MWLETGDPYKQDWQRRPPQLLEADFPTWLAFLKQNPDGCEEFFYNVAMTLMPIPVFAKTDKEIRLAMYPWSKRLDAAGRKGNVFHLYEVNANANTRSLGQAVIYRYLWKMVAPSYGLPPDAVSHIVTARIDIDMNAAAREYSVIVNLVVP